MKRILLISLSLLTINVIFSQNNRSTQQISILTGLESGTVTFGDYDNDGDMDMIVMGTDSMYEPQTQLYNNTGTGLAYVPTGIDNLGGSSADWGDFDNDGDLDLLITGYDANYDAYTSVFMNEGNDNFSYYMGAPGVSSGMAKWCDFNNDGFLDIVVTGSFSTAIYQNFNYEFYYTANTNIFQCFKSNLDCADFDKDGDMDIIVTGAMSYNLISYEPIMPEIKIFRNNGNFNFTEFIPNIPAVSCGSVKWGDYDNDGDLDVLIAGKNDQNIAITKVFRNDNGFYVDINAPLIGIMYGNASWGDLDNDGKLDIILTGGTSFDSLGYLQGATSQAYFNNGNDVFVNANYNLYPSMYSSVALADLDGDHAMDFVVAGYDPGSYMQYTDMYLNSATTPNTVPLAPTGLSSTINGNSVTLKWHKSTDAQTAQSGLSYNVRVSSYPTGQGVVSANANVTNGYRRVVDYGNTTQDTTYTFNYMPGGTVYWSVQAIDNNFEGSPFSTNASFILPPLPPLLTLPADSDFFVTARPSFHWIPSVGAATYKFQLSDTISFSNLIINTDTLTNASFLLSQDLIRNKKYFWRVNATNTTGISAWSEVWTFKPDINIHIDSTANVCIGSTIQLSATVHGGNTPFVYTWSPGASLNDSTIINPVVDITATTSFVVRVQDVKGWVSTDTVLITVRPLPSVTGGPDIAIWAGSSGQITSAASGGTPPYTYSWTPAATLSGPTYHSPTASPSVSTYYYVAAADSFGCVTPVHDTVLVDVMTITELHPGITGFLKANMSLGDYDNDNDLDLLISGQTTTNYECANKVYRNDNGTFNEIATPMDQSYINPACWADFDNDGDLDIFSTYWSGITLEHGYTIYENVNGNFVDQHLQLSMLTNGDAKPIDFDNDGGMDIIACGSLFNGGDAVMIGSFLQNNFGEDVKHHGYGIFDMETKKYEFRDLPNDQPFLHYRINDIKDIETGSEELVNLR